MKDFIFANLTDDLLHEAAALISACQNKAESYVAWLGLTTEEIKYQLQTLPVTYRESCSIILIQGAISGFLGAYISEPQSTLRLLGPFISVGQPWPEIARAMLNAFKSRVPNHSHTAKVAFYGTNVNCRNLYEANHFIQYNAEKTLRLYQSDDSKECDDSNHRLNPNHRIPNLTIRPFAAKDYDSFIRIHPSGAYFTGPEVIGRLNPHHRLIVAEAGAFMVGYVYLEISPGDQSAEICFINVAPEFRNQGIGSLLLSKAIHEAFQSDGVHHLEISVRVDNQRAEALYKKVGFIEQNVVLALQRDLKSRPWDKFV